VPEQALHTIISAQAMERVYANAYGNLLPIFDKLMATANTLAEQQALRADRNEQSVQQLTQALLRQTQSFLESREQQIAERERSVEEEEGASEGNEQFGLAPILNTMVMGALSGLANRPDGVQKVHELVNRITKVISELVGAKPEEGGNSK
jgi:Pyruvate/2-oxoacid:ferredoxin oxidoreductase gamma subunit